MLFSNGKTVMVTFLYIAQIVLAAYACLHLWISLNSEPVNLTIVKSERDNNSDE